MENTGAKVALIVNNDDMNISNIIMSDDGTGRDLTIPALLISKEDGKKIKDFYLKYEKDPSMLNKITFDINFEIVQFYLKRNIKK